MLEAAILLIFPFCMVFAAVSDMISMTIANRVSVLLVLAFAVLAPLTGMVWPDIGMHLAAGMVVLAITFALFAIGGMGGGDAKLMAATTVWFGFSMGLLNYLMISALVGGALTIALLIFRNSSLSMLAGNNLLLRHFADEKAGIPYGVALGIGGLFTFGQTPLAQWAMMHLAAG
ncbi:A24 family peptidase [Chelativorans sp. YIM 93263]|uniref:A24 family peptidase n=1 Tax=Chelativorans sp. YIM 93263 TaxID=2906648 RepID=UPI00237965BA|nr:prepilin peptidase [Chelativorans sp. YIM 93263]